MHAARTARVAFPSTAARLITSLTRFAFINGVALAISIDTNNKNKYRLSITNIVLIQYAIVENVLLHLSFIIISPVKLFSLNNPHAVIYSLILKQLTMCSLFNNASGIKNKNSITKTITCKTM